MSNCLVISDRENVSVSVQDDKSENIDIKNCTSCYIYILRETNQINLTNLAETTVFILKTKKVLVNDCCQIKCTANCDDIIISSTRNSDVYLFTTNLPQIKNKSLKIRVAPYNAAYNQPPINGTNNWDKYELDDDSSASILDASEFFTFVIPFGEEPRGISVDLPINYSRSLMWRERIAEERRKLVLEFCKRFPSHSTAIQHKIMDKFNRNVLEKEKGNQISQLATLEVM